MSSQHTRHSGVLLIHSRMVHTITINNRSSALNKYVGSIHWTSHPVFLFYLQFRLSTLALSSVLPHHAILSCGQVSCKCWLLYDIFSFASRMSKDCLWFPIYLFISKSFADRISFHRTWPPPPYGHGCICSSKISEKRLSMQESVTYISVWIPYCLIREVTIRFTDYKTHSEVGKLLLLYGQVQLCSSSALSILHSLRSFLRILFPFVWV